MLRARCFLFVVVVAAAVAVAGCASGPATTAEGRPVPTPALVNELESRRAPVAEFVDALAVKNLRARSIRALGRLEHLSAVPHILAALDDEDAAVRAAAAFAAGQLDPALAAGDVEHDRVAADVEAKLLAHVDDDNADVALAAVRALGRVGRSAARARLTTLAATTSTLQAPAFEALAISYRRRPAGGDAQREKLQQLAAQQVQTPSAVVVAEAAAYLLLRLGTGISPDTQAALVAQAKTATPEQAQTRIHLTRALAAGKTPTTLVDGALPTLLADADWRVRVEALRALASHPDGSIGPVLTALPKQVAQIAEPGMAHVVTEACTTLAKVGAASASLPVVRAVVSALPAGGSFAHARCTCAGVVDVLDGDASDGALAKCTSSMTPTQQGLFAVEQVALQRISSIERAAALKPFVVGDDVRVRVAAAGALCSDGSLAAVDVAATAITKETDPGVLSALLSCYGDSSNDDVLKDRTLDVAAGRLLDGTTFEQLEPLVAVAAAAHRRKGAAARALADRLAEHADVRVREAARGVRHGERALVPRARVVAVSPPASLPLAVVLHTPRGEIQIELDRDNAPRAVATFIELARQGVVDGTPFHRVIADFVAQGGDPRGDGSGGPGFTVPDEFADVRFERGTVGIAHAGKDTGSSQFFLTHSAQPHLDGNYTRLGVVVDGLAAMDALQPGDVLLSVEVTTALRPR